MGFILGEKSLQKLRGVRPELVKVVKRAIEISPLDFTVLEGVRTLQRQQELVKIGASHTLHSRHLTGHAVDLGVLLNGELRWDWPLYNRLSNSVKEAAQELGIPLEWGGDWKGPKDGPHYQLPWKEFP